MMLAHFLTLAAKVANPTAGPGAHLRCATHDNGRVTAGNRFHDALIPSGAGARHVTSSGVRCVSLEACFIVL